MKLHNSNGNINKALSPSFRCLYVKKNESKDDPNVLSSDDPEAQKF